MTKLVFFGTSDRSVPLLKALKLNFDLVLCVTKDNVLVGRHQKPKETQVKKWAVENGVNFVHIHQKLSNESHNIIEQIKLSGAEIGVVADFGFIIPQEILNLFPKGLINVHFSLLPEYRGASPVQFAILNGNAHTGITCQLMQKTLDTGPILHQILYPLQQTETSGQLYQTLFELSAQHLPHVVNNYLTGELAPKQQDESKVSYTHSPSHPTSTHIYKEDAKINWNNSVQQIQASIRAYHPWPIAWTTCGDMAEATDKITDFTTVKDAKNASKVIKIHEANIDGNKLSILKIQIEGGTVLTWKQFKNGYLL